MIVHCWKITVWCILACRWLTLSLRRPDARDAPKAKNTPDIKVLGDAAEHYSLSQFAFAGLPGTKMPDN